MITAVGAVIVGAWVAYEGADWFEKYQWYKLRSDSNKEYNAIKVELAEIREDLERHK